MNGRLLCAERRACQNRIAATSATTTAATSSGVPTQLLDTIDPMAKRNAIEISTSA